MATDYFSLTAAERSARVKAAAGVTAPPSPTATPKVGGVTGPAAIAGISAGTATTPKTPTPSTGYTPPAYGSNVAGFDSNNSNHIALADAGQQWASAKASGNTAGVSAAAALGESLRAGSGLPASYDSKAGVTSYGMPQEVRASAAPSTPSGGTPSMMFTPPSASQTQQIPIATPSIPVMDMNQIGQYADSQLSAELLRQRSAADQAIAAGKTTANQQIGALQTQFDRTKQGINDGRALSDFSRGQVANPFANMGKKTFDQGLIERERTQEDGNMAADFQTRQANVNQGLSDLENTINAKYAAAELTQGAERERMIQEIRNDERAYESMLRGDNRQDYLANSQLRNTDFNQALNTFQTNRGVYEDDRNFGYQAGQDQIRNDAQYGGTYNGNQTADQAQQSWQNRYNYGVATGTFSDGKKTVEKAQQDWSQAFQQGQFNFDKAQAAWDNNFKDKSFQQSMNEAAAGRGLQWASLNQREKEFIADQAFREKTFSYQKDQDTLKNNPAAQKAEDYYSYIDSSPTAFTKDEDGLPTQNNNTIESMILGSGLSNSEMAKLYSRYGIPMK